MVDYSFHSIQKDLLLLCSNLGEAKAKEAMDSTNQPLLQKELETMAVSYCVPQVPPGAIVEENEGQVRIISPEEDLPIEIPLETLTTITNCKKVAWACSLLEVAIAAGAVSLLVIANDFWKSSYKGVPIINSDILMCKDNWQPSTNQKDSFKMPFSIDYDGEKVDVDLELGTEVISVAGAKPPSCDDFCLTGLDIELPQAIPMQYNLIRQDGTVIPAVWKGFYNAGPLRLSQSQAMSAVVGKRKWLQTMSDE
jgi:hypothetical protein